MAQPAGAPVDPEVAVAYVRAVPSTFDQAVTAVEPKPALDSAVAAVQHLAYVAALRWGGFEVEHVPRDDDHPDSAFVEDAAVVVGESALATRPGHPSRQGEVAPVATTLAERLTVHRVEAPATLDGGDVLIAGKRMLVGVSTRTNEEGAGVVAALAEPAGLSVDRIEVGDGVLHLKTGLSSLDDHTLLWHPASCERSSLVDFDVIRVEGPHPAAANVVRLANGEILVASDFGDTARIVADRGFTARMVDISEFIRADGGPTCLSILLG